MSNHTGIHVAGKRWFHRGPGNTYHSVQIFRNGEQLAYAPMAYGYGDGYLQTAFDLLQKLNVIPADVDYGGTRQLREDFGISYSVADVSRKKDL